MHWHPSACFIGMRLRVRGIPRWHHLFADCAFKQTSFAHKSNRAYMRAHARAHARKPAHSPQVPAALQSPALPRFLVGEPLLPAAAAAGWCVWPQRPAGCCICTASVIRCGRVQGHSCKYAVSATEYAVSATEYAVSATEYAVSATEYAVSATEYAVSTP